MQTSTTLAAKHCPSCGKAEKQGEFIRNFCPACFSQRHKLFELPDEISAKRCAVCGRVFRLTNWQEENKKLLREIIESKLKSPYGAKIMEIKFNNSHRSNCFDVSLEIAMEIEGKSIERNAATTLCFEQTQCLQCSRETGGFYDAIIQLRPGLGEEIDKEKMEKKAEKVVRLIGKSSGRVVKMTEDKNGIDIYVAGINEAFAAAKKVSHDVKHTRKLVGRKQGRDLYRHTFCARV